MRLPLAQGAWRGRRCYLAPYPDAAPISQPGAERGNVLGMEGVAASVVLMAILAGVLLVVAFDVFCLVHLAAAGHVRVLPKLAWAAVIVCVSPLGGLAYLLSRRLAPRPPRRPPDHRVAADDPGGWLII